MTYTAVSSVRAAFVSSSCSTLCTSMTVQAVVRQCESCVSAVSAMEGDSRSHEGSHRACIVATFTIIML
jgi:hypothetical protein